MDALQIRRENVRECGGEAAAATWHEETE